MQSRIGGVLLTFQYVPPSKVRSSPDVSIDLKGCRNLGHLRVRLSFKLALKDRFKASTSPRWPFRLCALFAPFPFGEWPLSGQVLLGNSFHGC